MGNLFSLVPFYCMGSLVGVIVLRRAPLVAAILRPLLSFLLSQQVYSSGLLHLLCGLLRLRGVRTRESTAPKCSVYSE